MENYHLQELAYFYFGKPYTRNLLRIEEAAWDDFMDKCQFCEERSERRWERRPCQRLGRI